MTVKEFYDAAGGGYEEISAKFPSDNIIKRFLAIFGRDTNFQLLKDKLAEGDVKGAFAAAHTLKGMILNLSLKGVAGPVEQMTEALRNATDVNEALALLPALEEAYERAVKALAQLQ